MVHPLPRLITERRTALAALCQRTHARGLDLFGSAVREDFDAQSSNLDFLVVFEDLSSVRYAEAFFELQEGVEQLFTRPMDLVVECAIRNPYFKQRVNAERRRVYSSKRC